MIYRIHSAVSFLRIIISGLTFEPSYQFSQSSHVPFLVLIY